MRTIRKENFAISDFLFPSIIPVAIVAPERETAGRIAKAWANPMINESKNPIGLSFGLIKKASTEEWQ